MIGKRVTWRGIECEVTSIEHSQTHRQDVAYLRAIKGEPFSRYSDGGPYQVNWTVVPAAFLLPLSESINLHNLTITDIPAEVENGQKVGQ